MRSGTEVDEIIGHYGDRFGVESGVLSVIRVAMTADGNGPDLWSGNIRHPHLSIPAGNYLALLGVSQSAMMTWIIQITITIPNGPQSRLGPPHKQPSVAWVASRVLYGIYN